MDYLAKLHEHPRDRHISFDEGPHIYTIDGDSDFTSVTTWNHAHFQEFDADAIIDKMMKSKNWPNSKYYGMTPDEIKDQWEQNRDQAASAGTKMHYNIECFYNRIDVSDEDKDCDEWRYFEEFYEEYKHLTPYRTEWMVWDKELKFAGSIDMTFENEDGTIEIYDWKRSKEIRFENRWQSGKTQCVSHLPDCNYYHYSLQLNTYKALLEKNYGKTITGMYLVCLHPNNQNKSYQRIKVKDLSQEIEDLFELRKAMIEQGITDVHELDTVKLPKKQRSNPPQEDDDDSIEDEWMGSSSE
jgi:hypothetical protein